MGRPRIQPLQCITPDCTRRPVARSRCYTHYQQYRRANSDLEIRPRHVGPLSMQDRLKLDTRTDPDYPGCLIWSRSVRGKNGTIPQVHAGTNPYRTSNFRVALWKEIHGPDSVPDGQTVRPNRSTCHRFCCTPHHLSPQNFAYPPAPKSKARHKGRFMDDWLRFDIMLAITAYPDKSRSELSRLLGINRSGFYRYLHDMQRTTKETT